MPYQGDETAQPVAPSSPTSPLNPPATFRRRRRHAREYNHLRYLMIAGICALIIFAPLEFGGREMWAWGSMGIGLGLLFALWIVRSWLRGKIEYWQNPLHLGFLILFALTLVQLLPLGSLLGVISPYAAGHWQAIANLGIAGVSHTISLLPGETFNCLLLILMALGMFFLVTNTFTTRRSLLILPLAIISSATLNALIGIIEQFGSEKKSFWYLGISRYSVTGTYINKNHFALLLEMGILVALGLAMAALFARGRRSRQRDSAVELLSKHEAFFSLTSILTLMAMLMALLFSFSRAGTLCAFIAMIAFSLMAIHYSGRSLRLTGVIAAIAAVFIIASSRGLDYIWRRFEVLASGESMSGAVRLDLWKSSLSLLGRHWFTGVGFGSYRYTSPRFESGPVPDSIAFYAHNDWLELCCEFGIPATILLLAILGYVIVKTALRLHRRHDFVTKWVGLGALLALVSVAGHELFDYGLRMHGNLLICVSILSLATICCHLPGNNENRPGPELRSIKLTPAKGRIFLILGLVIVLVFILCLLPVRLAGTPLAYLNARVSPFATHKMATPEAEAQERIQRADEILTYCQNNTQALMQRAENNVILATLAMQEEQAKLLGKSLEEIRALEESNLLHEPLQKLAEPLRKNISGRYKQAVADLRRACALAPTNGQYLALYAKALEQAGSFDNDLDEELLHKVFDLAHQSYPKVSSTTMQCAEGAWRRFLRMGAGDEQQRTRVFNQALDLFTEALRQNPYSAPQIYDTVYFIIPEVKILRSITPGRLISREFLYDYLFNIRKLDACLEELKTTRRINAEREDLEKGELHDSYEFFRNVWFSKAEISLSLQKREIILLGLTERWQERAQRMDTLRETLRPTLQDSLITAKELIAEGKFHQASINLRKILQTEPFHPEAIITQAKLLQSLGDSARVTRLLLRLAYTDESVATEILSQALVIVKEKSASNAAFDSNHCFPVRDFLQAALMVKLEQYEAGLTALNSLITKSESKLVKVWIQEHLLYYFAGLALENLGRPEEALLTYAKALSLCPRHLPSARNSARLSKSYSLPEELAPSEPFGELRQVLADSLSWLETLNPELPVDVDFGGKFRLLGYTVTPRIITPGGLFDINFYWYCEDDIQYEYKINCVYSRGRERTFHDNHYIRGIGFDMVGWRVGEVIEVLRKVSPSYLDTMQKGPGIRPGLYDLDVRTYPRAQQAERLIPLVRCQAPAFEVTDQPLLVPELD
ncbi:MAG: O-antigen ligase family protein [Planctomycetes bacterium]|nr:O-antigen ligase family protein [Planctomycetota bacterium]